jgi:hypothetical protein
MKRGIVVFAALGAAAMAADFNGYIIDESCASKAAMKGNEACARKCMKGGAPAVLLSADNKIYKLDDQGKVSEHAGHKVVVTGALKGDTIQVEGIKIDSGCVPGPTGCQ